MILTAGKVRGLTATSNEKGIFTILAVDHRDSMRTLLSRGDPVAVTAEAMTKMKLDLIAGVGDLASAVLLDPEYSALQAIATRTLGGHTPFLCAVEAQGYLGDPNARVTTLLDGWSVQKAKRLGASGIKLLLLYRPDSEAADEQDAFVARVVEDCRVSDIPLFLEPVAYASGTGEYGDERRRIVCESARRLGALGPDVLKVQFPVEAAIDADRGSWADACAELDEASPVPWALLSGGDPFDVFSEQVGVACASGASGFLVGRALWGELIDTPTAEQGRLIDTVMRPRFTELTGIATSAGADWASRHRLPDLDETAYESY